MNRCLTAILAAVALCVSLVSTVAAGQDAASQRLAIAEKNGAYELSVPVSRLVMTVPKGQLVATQPAASSGNPRYFSFDDKKAALVLSGWFEPEQEFKGLDAFWAGEQRGLTQNGIRIENIVKDKIQNWQVVLYEIRLPGGRSSNMRAEFVQAGTWIDLHLSITSNRSEAENQAALRKVLETIRVVERMP